MKGNEYLVHWVGKTAPTWEPHAIIKDCKALRVFEAGCVRVHACM